MEYTKKVNVDFVVTGLYIDYDIFIEEVGIIPTIWRTKEDWPEIIKENNNLPDDLKPRYEWGINYAVERCSNIEEPIREIINKLGKQKKNLLALCEKYKLEKSLIITLYGVDTYVPELCLAKDIIKEFAELDAEIIFDIC